MAWLTAREPEKLKKYISSRAMTEEIINLMSLAGTNPMTDTKFGWFLGYCYVFVTFAVVVLMALNFWKTPHEHVGDIVKDLIILIGFIQITVKQYTAIQQKATLKTMVRTTWDSFWNLDSIDKETRDDILDLYRKTNILTFIYSSGAMAAVYSIILQTIFFSDKGLIMEIWVPNKEALLVAPYYHILILVEVIVITLGVYIGVAQLDKLFIVMIALVFVQFKLIKMKVKQIGTKDTKEENYKLLRDSVIHHNLVLKFVAGFESVYSQLFLPTVASNIVIATINMWGFITEEALSDKLMFVCVYITVMSQVLAYCTAGQIVQDSAINLGEAAYNCDWTKVHDPKIRMGLMMMISQSQRKIELTVGGLMVLCMESFAALSRASFSFLAFIVNVRE